MPYSHLTNAVISDTDAEMIQKPVTVRDGDDLLEVNLPAEDETVVEEDEGAEVEQEVETEGGENEDESSGDEAEGTEFELPEYQAADPKDLTEAAALMREADAGQADLTAKALEAGLSQDALDKATTEFAKDGKFTEGTYEALAKAGFSKSFVDSYMAGQEAVATKFVQSIYNHVGGQENFVKVTQHIAATKPEVAQAFDAAVERNDVATIRALLDSAVAEFRQSPPTKEGKAPKRNLAAAAKAAAPGAGTKANKVEGFTNRQEMVKAMSDKRYGKDAAYRREVELKVLHATF